LMNEEMKPSIGIVIGNFRGFQTPHRVGGFVKAKIDKQDTANYRDRIVRTGFQKQRKSPVSLFSD